MSAYVWQRAAAPSAGRLHEAAGRVPGAAGLAVAHVPGWSSRTGNGPTGLRLQGGGLLEPGQAEAAGLVAGLFSHVAFVAVRTAVLVIAAAHGLERWEGSLMPETSRQQLISSGIRKTLRLIIFIQKTGSLFATETQTQ